MPSPEANIFDAALAHVRQSHPGRRPVRVLIELDDGAQVPVSPPPRHSPDYRSCSWKGKTYYFTAAQAAIVRVLWKAWESDTPDVSQEYLVTKAGIETEKLSIIFRGNDAWGNMVVPGESKGTLRLASST